MKNIFLSIFTALALFASAQKKAKPASTLYSIQISGKVDGNCHKSSDLYFGEFHGSEHDLQPINVNANGEFTTKVLLKEPGLVYIKKGLYSQYFIVSAKEKAYKIELSCSNDILNPLLISNSAENIAYQDFLNLHKKLTSDIDVYRDKNINDSIVFQEFSKRLFEFQTELTFLARQNPQTHSANYLVVADRLSEKDLQSIESLRQNYLKRQFFSDPKFYNTLLPSFILENYIAFISDKTDGSFAPFETLLNTASKNAEAAKRLQDALYDALLKSKRQDLINCYINWSQAHPTKMLQPVVVAKLQRLSKCMVGGPFINLKLKDTIGNVQQLKDVVMSSKYTLLIFYSPGCWHCQQTLPKLGPISTQYKSKGLKIYTVAPKNENSEWINFIKKYLTPGWINVMEEQNNTSLGEYVIATFPTFILINSQGKIVSKMDAESIQTDIQKWVN